MQTEQKFDAIGDYVILKELGSGGFGRVFLAQKDGGNYALKLFTESRLSDVYLKLFQKEFQILKRHPHPGIVRVEDFGWHDGAPFFTAEYIEGVCLNAAMCGAGAEQIVPLAFHALRALHFLHQHGLKHRDLKPDNILVCGDTVKLIDFGLTGLASEYAAGTRPFMAPELFRREPYGEKCDLYSLGVSFYESIYAENPFRDLNPDEYAQKKQRVISLSALPKRPAIPAALARLILSLIHPEPVERPSALQAISQLMPFLRGRQILATLKDDALLYLDHPAYIDVDGQASRIEKELPERRGVVCEIRGGAGVGKKRLLEEVKTSAALEGLEIRSDLPPAHGDALVNLAYWRPIVFVIGGDDERWAACRKIWEQTAGHWRVLTVAPWSAAEIETLLARLFSYPAEHIDQKTLLAKTGGNPRRVLGVLADIIRQEPSVMFDEALMNQSLGKTATHSREISERPDDIPLPERFRRAEDLLHADHPKDALQLLDGVDWTALPPADWEKWHWLAAEARLQANDPEQAIVLFERLKGKTPQDAAVLIAERMGLAYLRHGLVAEADTCLQSAIVACGTSADRIRCGNYSAQVRMAQGRLDEAQRMFEESWRSYETDLDDGERRKIGNFNLAALYLQKGDHAACLKQAQREIVFYERLGRREALARTLYLAGEGGYRLKDFAAARAHWEKGMVIARDLRNQELLLRFHNGLGNLLWESGELEAAFANYEKAVRHAYSQEDASALARITLNQALIRKNQGRVEQARALCEGTRQYLLLLKNADEKNELLRAVAAVFPSGPKKGKEESMNDTGALLQAYQSLLHISELISSERNLPALIGLVLRCAIQLSGAERGAVILLDDNGELNVAGTLNADKDEVLGQISLKIAREVLKTGSAVYTQDAAGDARFSDNRSVILFNLRAIFCLPIHSLGKTAGVLYLDHTRSINAFEDFSREILAAYCQQVGVCLENARLFGLYENEQQALRARIHAVQSEKDKILAQLDTDKKIWLARDGYPLIRTQSAAMFTIFATLDPIIVTNLGVMILGESGTGKELLAKSIHFQSPRKDGPYIAANCGAIPENLLESELFGYKAGAFTGAARDKKGLFEAASRGTLFLDEVGELSLPAQVKLLRVLQEGEVVPIGETTPRKIDVRVVSATHKDLHAMMAQKLFREDLFYRLCEFHVHLPPLRERKEDITLLTEVFIDEYRKEHGSKAKIRPSPDLAYHFLDYDWPGNVRELRNTVRVGCALSKEGLIRPENYPPGYGFLTPRLSAATPIPQRPSGQDGHSPQLPLPLLTLKDHEKMIYAKAFAHHGFEPKPTYEALGISAATFFKRLNEWDLRRRDHPLYLASGADFHLGRKLKDHLNDLIRTTYESLDRHPYKTIAALKISPGKFYKWQKMATAQGMIPK